MQEYNQGSLAEPPAVVDTVIPSKCRSLCAILRWWQPLMQDANNKSVAAPWIIDNIAITRPQLGLKYIYDSFRFNIYHLSHSI